MSVKYTPSLSELEDYMTRSFEEVVLPWSNRLWRRKWTTWKLYQKSRKAARKRERVRREYSFPVPPMVIISPTSACNLSCDHCYAGNYRTPCHLSPHLFHSLIKQAKELGCFFFIVVGGEPFLYKDLLDIIARHKDAVFLIFTNGTLLFGNIVERVSKLLNVIPIVSFGDLPLNGELDTQRCPPVPTWIVNTADISSVQNDPITGGYDDEATETNSEQDRHEKRTILDTQKSLERLSQLDAFYGFSVVVTKRNLATVQTMHFLDKRIAEGCRVGFYVEYIPVGRNPDPSLCLSQSQRQGFRKWVKMMRTKRPIFLAQFPNDEEYFGGCMAAGKGLIHITAEGYVEPCPAIHKATDNIHKSSLRQCLNSLFFESIRTSSEKLSDGHLPCKLLDGSCLTGRVLDCLGVISTEDSQIDVGSGTSAPVNYYGR